MEQPATFGLVLLAVFLSLSAATKTFARKKPQQALQELGVPAVIAVGVVTVSVPAEWLLSGAVVLAPRSAIVETCVAAAFGAFALVGCLALVRRRRIECGCFGAIRTGRLGVQQLGQLPFALSIAFLAMPNAPRLAPLNLIVVLLLVELLAAAVVLSSFLPTWRALRLTRASLASARSFHASQQAPSIRRA